MCCRCCSVTQQKIWVFGLGIIFIAFGLVCIIWWPNWITDKLYEALPLSACSRTYDKWVITPIPVYMHMYLFNWTNPDDVRTAGIKPNFQEVGPYVFRENKVKDDIIWHHNKTVTFYGGRTWYFEPELSGGRLDDLITCPHLPSIAAANVVRNESKIIKVVFNNILNNHGGALFQTHTANEWLFEGFFDEFLDYAMNLNNSMTGNIESNRFAWFLNRNGSKEFEGTFTVHTGQGDLRQMGDLKYWKGVNHTGFYDGECGRLNGSTSDLWVPNRELDEYITVFIADTCRIINLVPTGQFHKIEGIKGMRYQTDGHTFDNGQLNGDMRCYCSEERQLADDCPKSGATDLGPCADGVPMYMSHAHFMWADPSYADTITGMSPDSNKHSFFIIMEPKLGVPLQVNAVVQVSLHVRQDNDIKILSSIEDFYAPLFITSSKAIMNKELAAEVKLALSLPKIGFFLGIALTALGGILIFTGITLTMLRTWHGQKKHKN